MAALGIRKQTNKSEEEKTEEERNGDSDLELPETGGTSAALSPGRSDPARSR